MTTSGFLYRDILKYILPTILLFFLIVPLFATKIDTKAIVAAGIVSALVLGDFLSFLSTSFFSIFEDIRQVKKVKKWMNGNWKYRKVFYNLDKEERDYLYLTGAYIEFCKNTGLILVVFIIIIIFKAVINVKVFSLSLLSHQTNLFSLLYVNTFILVILCGILIFFLKKSIISESKYLFYPEGQYDYFAEKVQKREQEFLALNIYGQLQNSYGKGLIGNEIKLIKSGQIVASTETGTEGYWSIKIEENLLNENLKISTVINQIEFCENILVQNYNKPFVILKIQ